MNHLYPEDRGLNYVVMLGQKAAEEMNLRAMIQTVVPAATAETAGN